MRIAHLLERVLRRTPTTATPVGPVVHRTHQHLRHWGVDTGAYAAELTLTDHPQCSHGPGSVVVDTLSPDAFSARCPDLKAAHLDPVRLAHLVAVNAYVAQFSYGDRLHPEYALTVLADEPVAHARVLAAAEKAWKDLPRAVQEFELTGLLGDITPPATTPSTYVYAPLRGDTTMLALGAFYVKEAPGLVRVPHRVARIMVGLGYAHPDHVAAREKADTPAVLDTALTLVRDGSSLAEALVIARTLES